MAWSDAITAEVKRLRADGFSWTHIAQTIKRNYPDLAETESQVLRKARHIARVQRPDRQDKSSKRYSADGSVESVCLIELWDNDDLSPDDILTFHHLDPKRWEIVSCTNNIWHGMTGKQNHNELKQLYQSKITARPRKIEITLDDIDAYFKSKQYTKPTIEPLQYDPSGETLEICLPDLHVGLLSWAQETGADYDIKIAKERFAQCMSDIVTRCKGRTFKRIYFATLGDLLHVDNDNQTTTKGTFQQTDGRTPKMFDTALDMLVDGIDALLTIAPVEVVYLSGNHDRATGYTLIKALSCAYRKQDGITFDVTPNPQKWRLIGVSIVGWTHGDMSRKNIGNWLQDRARREYGQAQYAEIHAGHLHSEGVSERYTGKTINDTQTYGVGGVVVRHLPTISNSSFWEHQQGYSQGNKTMMCFVWHDDRGLRETWYSNL